MNPINSSPEINGQKAITTMLFTMFTVGIILFNHDYHVESAAILLLQNVLACYNDANIDSSKMLFKVNFAVFAIDCILLFLTIGIWVTGSEILRTAVQYFCTVNLVRALAIVSHYFYKVVKNMG